ncbi:MAG: DNA gyrase subunit A [Halodesulfurarchaeum sp.]
MSSETPPTDAADRVERVRIEDEMEQSYIDYAMSVIAGRALPDVRDGLKPVHRRILYAMQEDGVTSNAGHRKSSSIVGTTMGDYHPHGDSAIYDTLVRMAQDFSMRYPLVDGQGNFGSIDGDPAAAMRYTEARMAPIAEELLADIDRDTVDFDSNYDDRLEEPAVLPAGFPNLLANGSSGIAVGMSTNIPPHNLGEVVDATIQLIDDPDCSVADLIDTRDGKGNGSDGPIKGPDFPTGGTIVGRNPIREAYTTGRGHLRVRANYELIERSGAADRIVISEIPYQANKSRMVERIAGMVNDGELEGVSDLRDESDRDGIRVVIDLKRGANPDLVENKLLDSVLERTFGVINLALVDGEPEVLTLKEMLEEYVAHRREVIRRRTQDELDELEDRAHVLEGRLQALENVDGVVETIQDATDRDAAIEALEARYDLSTPQAEHIVRMQLGSLTSMEAQEVEAEYESVTARIERLETILADEDELLAVIKEELREIREEYDDDRRTTITDAEGQVTNEDLIPEEEVVVVVTEDDYVKRMPVSQFEAQHRGGKGIIGTRLKDGDRVSSVFTASTHDYLLCFTTLGQVYRLKVYEVPEMSRTARGKSAVNLLELDDDEEISAVVATGELEGDRFLTFATRDGYVKRTAVDEYENIFSTGIRAIRLDDGDRLVDVEVTDGDRDLVVGTRQGMAIRFPESEVRTMGRAARGVRGIDLEGDDEVVGVAGVHADQHDWLLTVTEQGYGKRSNLDDYRLQSRYGKGLIDIKTDSRNGPVVALEAVEAGDDLIAMSHDGQILRTPVEEISRIGRNTKGVTVMDLEEADTVACLDILSVPDSDEG